MNHAAKVTHALGGGKVLKTDLVAVASRVLALVALLHAVKLLPMMIRLGPWYSSDIGIQGAFSDYLISFLLVLGLAWFLWFGAEWIASKVPPGVSSETKLSRADLLATGFAVVGAFFVVTGLAETAFSWVSISMAEKLRENRSVFDRIMTWPDLASGLVSTVFGLILIYGRSILRVYDWSADKLWRVKDEESTPPTGS